MLSAAGYPGVNEGDLGKLLPQDQYETELRVMAEVRGYFQVSYKVRDLFYIFLFRAIVDVFIQRIIDNAPSLIDYHFVRRVAKELQSHLLKRFELGTAAASGRCAAYLAEDPAVVAKRNELSARQNRLVDVQLKLDNFGMGPVVD
jgi:hypothetical protein